MADESVLARIDRTLDRIDARLEESEQRWAERDRRWEEMAEESRRYNDALLERHARITQDQIAALTALQEEIVGQRDEIARQREESKAEAQAQREALMKMIDRLPPPHPQG